MAVAGSESVKSDLQSLLELEHIVSSGQRPSVSEMDLGLKAYEARILLGNGKMSDTLCELSPKNEIQKLKSDIFCGNLNEAKELAVALLRRYAMDSEIQSEIKLELSRVFLYQGEWDLCLRMTQEASALHPALLSQLTLWQIEAAAAGEKGDIAHAMKRIEQVESLKNMFPGGNVLFYARNQKVKLWARQGRMIEAQRLLRDLWREQLKPSAATISLDPLETLSRTELEIATHLRTEGSVWSLMSRRCTKESGERLFEDIALADLALHHKTLQTPMEASLLQKLLASPFQRVQDQIQTHGLGKIESVSALKPSLAETLDFRFVYLAPSDLWIDIEERRQRTIPADSVIAKALGVTCNSSETLSLELFFNKIYDLAYSKDRHSGTIRTLMTRIRQATGMDIAIKDGRVQYSHPFLVIPK